MVNILDMSAAVMNVIIICCAFLIMMRRDISATPSFDLVQSENEGALRFFRNAP